MKQVIIIGDSSHNTLGAVRSFGHAKIPQTLILVTENDVCFVKYSKYLQQNNCFTVPNVEDCQSILDSLHSASEKSLLMTTFDSAAEWVDSNEQYLSQHFLTPCRGKQLGKLFNKAEQCKLAAECGLTVPFSVIYKRGTDLPVDVIKFPLITKPLISASGEKSDIHICQSLEELNQALANNSHCDSFIIQEFVEKEYEIDAVGICTDNGVVMGGAIQKIRHWPRLVGAGAYGIFRKITDFDLNISGIQLFWEKSDYRGPFSVEFLHTKDHKNYFMEFNFRNEGLAYASTCAGANLHALYFDGSYKIDWKKFRNTYMMNYSIDFLYVKDGDISIFRWLRDFLRTRCFINFAITDLNPLIEHYKEKLCKKHHS